MLVISKPPCIYNFQFGNKNTFNDERSDVYSFGNLAF